MKVGNTVALTIGMFVDDIVIAGINTLEIAKFKETMISRFKMTDLERLNWYLGTRCYTFGPNFC
jgi:hypothetical protein